MCSECVEVITKKHNIKHLTDDASKAAYAKLCAWQEKHSMFHSKEREVHNIAKHRSETDPGPQICKSSSTCMHNRPMLV